MPDKSGEMTLTIAMLASVFGSLAAAAYAVAGAEPSPIVALFLSLGPLLAVILWLQGDAARTGVGSVLDLGYFLLLAWPFVIPWYAFKTRGRSSWRLILGLFGLILAPYATALVVGYLLGGAMAAASDQSVPKLREAPAALTAPVTSMPAQTARATTKADLVIVDKEARTLRLYKGDAVLKSYRVALGRNPKGHKQEEGDSRTPEGRYVIDSRNAASKFHRALHISYPSEEDRRRARARGVKPGGDIMIHGLPNGMSAIGKAHRLRDWTDGCIAVTNEEIEEIWRLVPTGTRIEIRP